VNVRDLPAAIDPRQQPNGVVIRIYRWRDGAVLRERHLSVRDHLFAKADPTLEMLAELDAEDTFTNGAVAGHRAVVVIGYDGDHGGALSAPMLITDDPAITGS
jgi:hypothetical protein